MLSVLTTLLLLMVIVICWSINYSRKKQRLHQLIGTIDGPPTLPFLGSVLYLSGGIKNTVDNIIDLANKYKSPWKMLLGGEVFIIITDPEDAEVVLNKCLAKGSRYKFVEELLGEGLFTGPVDKWKKHRKVISATFNMQILNSYIEVFSEHSMVLAETLRKYAGKGVFDVFPLLTQFSLEITCETIMGKRLNEKSLGQNYVKTLSSAMNVVYTRLLHFWLHPNFIWKRTSYSRQLRNMCKNLRDFVIKITSEKQTEYFKKKETEKTIFCEEHRQRKGFLDHLIEVCDTTDNWTDEELMEEAQTMAAAGVESLGSVPSFALMMIGMHPLIQEKLYQEIENIFESSDRKMVGEDLNRMVYLERIIKETLRLFPVASVISRYNDKEIKIKSHTIPEGCEYVVGVLYIHRNPEIWTDPLKFNPDRFSPEEVSKRHPYSYLPFSAGPRNCIGFKFAMMAMKTVLASVVRKFRISTDLKDVSEIKGVPGIVFKSAVGYRIALEERERLTFK